MMIGPGNERKCGWTEVTLTEDKGYGKNAKTYRV